MKTDVVEASEFPNLVQRYGIRAVPTTVIDERVILPGAMDETALLESILRVAEGKPITAGERKTGAVSVLPSPQGSQQSTAPGGGLILPR